MTKHLSHCNLSSPQSASLEVTAFCWPKLTADGLRMRIHTLSEISWAPERERREPSRPRGASRAWKKPPHFSKRRKSWLQHFILSYSTISPSLSCCLSLSLFAHNLIIRHLCVSHLSPACIQTTNTHSSTNKSPGSNLGSGEGLLGSEVRPQPGGWVVMGSSFLQCRHLSQTVHIQFAHDGTLGISYSFWALLLQTPSTYLWRFFSPLCVLASCPGITEFRFWITLPMVDIV